MKNTKNKGTLRFLIYKSGDNYIGICFELGIVEEEKDVDKLIYRLRNGAEAIVGAVIKNNLDDSHLNKKVAIKYYICWYFSSILKIKNALYLLQSRQISNFRDTRNLAPSCI